MHGVDLRVVPDMYDGLAWNSPIEYIGQFPTIPLHRGHVPELGLMFKRVLDVLFLQSASAVPLALLLVIAIAVKLDSRGRSFTHPSASAKRAASSSASSSAPWCGMQTSAAPTSCT